MPDENKFLETLKIAAGAPKILGGRWLNKSKTYEERLASGNLKEIASVYRDCKANNTGDELNDDISVSKRILRDEALSTLAICYAEIIQISVPGALHSILKAIENPELDIKKKARDVFAPPKPAEDAEAKAKKTKPTPENPSYVRRSKALEVTMQIDADKLDLSTAEKRRHYEFAKTFYADNHNKSVLLVISTFYAPEHRDEALRQYQEQRKIATTSLASQRSSIAAAFNRAVHNDLFPAPAPDQTSHPAVKGEWRGVKYE